MKPFVKDLFGGIHIVEAPESPNVEIKGRSYY